MKNFKFLVLLFVLNSCKGNTNTNLNSNKIENQSLIIENQVLENNRLYYFDLFNNINFLNPGVNKFELKEKYFQLIDGKYKISYFLKANEKISIRSNNYLELISGDKKRDLELNFSKEFFEKFDLKNLNLWSIQLAKLGKGYFEDPKKRENEFQNEYQDSRTFLSTYAFNNHLENDFLTLFDYILKFRILNRELQLGKQSSKFPVKYLYDLKEKNKIYFQNKEMLFLDTFRSSLLWHSQILETTKSISEKVGNLMNNYPSNNFKWVLLSMIITEKSSYPLYNYSKNEIEILENSFLDKNENSELLEYNINTKYLEDTNFNENEVVETNFQTKQLNLASGKITYLDFWASWCGPCRAEMPHSKTVIQEFAKKGVNFIFLSIDENPTAWKKASTQIGLVNSYLIPNGSNSKLCKKFKISSIPRYIILNEKGVVINLDAPRPSEPNLKELFNKLLKEK